MIFLIVFFFNTSIVREWERSYLMQLSISFNRVVIVVLSLSSTVFFENRDNFFSVGPSSFLHFARASYHQHAHCKFRTLQQLQCVTMPVNSFTHLGIFFFWLSFFFLFSNDNVRLHFATLLRRTSRLSLAGTSFSSFFLYFPSLYSASFSSSSSSCLLSVLTSSLSAVLELHWTSSPLLRPLWKLYLYVLLIK